MKNKQIEQLRDQGLGYKRIASELEMTLDAVKYYCRKNKLTTESLEEGCRECHKFIDQHPKMKKRQFCNEECRKKWWKEHRTQGNLKLGKVVVCKNCKKKFKVSKNNPRKYCSHTCYIEYRFGGSENGE